MPQITDSRHRESAQIRDSNRQQRIASCFMIWHTGRESYRRLLKVLSLLCQCVKCVLSFSRTHHHIIDILIYTIIHNTHTILCHTIQYIPYLHTLLYTMLYSTVHIYSYAHILWCYDNTITWSVITPSKHTYHTCIYVTFCHALYYNLSYIQ